ncbi:MAG: hypothetical protein HOV94_35405 [Saccharothrix sp.]|nr:hypothetical protein [Saccharothrix sp.]
MSSSREHGDLGSLLDLDVFEPTCTGAEGIWTDLADWDRVPRWDQPAK